ncbi:LIC_12071 family protein [Leptospira kanakyensis]|uniref:Uncharacterized protein n=1 Tax=Leptospira kanakyensis TaxID=2484968 RepID=A0A6N4Q969_9LEPT|nr:hypothetical protein [Leptospira kanakyensis]MCW7467934.1 hypothetical protein [Leptospira kanakyensis]MCW7482531.1 hypothetical protein [Leptospira kanakyensis]TGK49419.1 hypothetical protein EHQ11_15465 [Leptospira kanakyensis]TGK60341.1 hypothetical protein EHQ16_09725 [Leptospira kanakyensis]TGK67740.1 hypothetical protein EHQ18_14525 [Leptospira kanakyensis]
MKYSRFFLSFILFFFLCETLALSAVVWTFYESLQNALTQEQFVSDHRARDLTLALAKSSEQRLNNEGYMELEKMFHRYVEQSKNDPEEFYIQKISLYSVDATLLVSTDTIYTPDELKKRKPDENLLHSTFFKKGIRMKKWEWSEAENGENPIVNSKRDPKVRSGFEWVLSYLPLAKSNTVRLTSPLYKPGTLDVSGLVVLVYERGNLGLLFENQWKLVEWMVFNYILFAFVVSLILTGAFVTYTMLVARDSSVTPKESKNLPLFEKKTVEPKESNLEPVLDLTENSNQVPIRNLEVGLKEDGNEVEILSEGPLVSVVPSDSHQTPIRDAIFLG